MFVTENMSEAVKRRRLTRQNAVILTRVPAIISTPTIEQQLEMARAGYDEAIKVLYEEKAINRALARRVQTLEAALTLQTLINSSE